jgi:D-3-phosphoglycerate dehydrogenase
VFLDYSVMDAEVIQRCEKLKFICFLGIGYSNCIDVEAAARKGVTVTYTPDYGATSVAEFTLGMILSLIRHIAFSYHSLQKGEWETIRFQGRELNGKTLGVVGRGTPGRREPSTGSGWSPWRSCSPARR